MPPLVVPKGTPLPPTQRAPLYQNTLPTRSALAKAEQHFRSAEGQLRKEWADFESGACALPYRVRSLQRFHKAAAALIALEADSNAASLAR